MAIALLSNTKAGGSGVASPAINTTGAKLIVIGLTQDFNTNANVTDSAGNTWTQLTRRNNAFSYSQLLYCINPTTSASHTFTATAAANDAICIAAFSGSGIYEADTGNNNTSSTTIQPGSITPAQNNELVITTATITATATTLSINGGFAITDQQIIGSSPSYWGNGLAYLIQTTAAAANPTWTYSTTPPANACAMACFRESPTATMSVAITEGADAVAATVFGNASMAVAITESPDVVAAALGSTFSLSIAITESPDAIFAELGYQLYINIASEDADTVSLILDNPGSWDDCADPATDWTECSDPETTWTDCPDPSTNWTVN